jgi:hypothetical protein
MATARRSTSRRLAALAAAIFVLAVPAAALAKRTLVYVHDRQTGGGVYAFAADKSAKRLVFAGPNGVMTANIDDKREGSLTGLDLVDFTVASATNAVVAVR